MKRSILLIAIFLFLKVATATHLKGGYITYQWKNGMTYEITLNLFSDPLSAADGNTAIAIIDYNDGMHDTIQRTSTVLVDSRTRQSIYQKNHTFPSEGNYRISFTDQNMIDGIANVNFGNSKDLALTIEALLIIDNAMGRHSSPLPLSYISEPIVTMLNDLFYNPTFCTKYKIAIQRYDSLSYELVKPNLPNYFFQDSLSINPFNGVIKWIYAASHYNIPFPSYFLISYKVKIYSIGILIGYTNVVQMIKVLGSSSPIFPVVNFPNTDSTLFGWNKKIVSSANLFSQEVNYTINPSSPATTSFYGNLPLKGFTDSSTYLTARYFMNFNPDSTFIQRSVPYFFTIRNTFANQVTRDYSLAVYYGAPIYFSINELNAKNPGINVFPNPFKNSCTFLMNDNSGYYQIFISDLSGKQIFSGKIKGNEFSFDATDLKPGNYFYSIESDEGNVLKGKLVLTE